MSIIIKEDLCIGCGICLDSCAFEAINIINGKAYLNDKCTVCGSCLDVCPVEAIVSDQKEVYNEADLAQYRGVWVFAEQREARLQKVAIELLGEGKKIANKLGVPLCAILLGSNVGHIAPELIKYGADKVFLAEHELLDVYTTEAFTRVIYDLVQTGKPEVLLIGATTIGRDLGPRLAARLGTGLTADCTSLEVDMKNRNLLQTRPAFGGNLMATIICPHHRPQMSTIRPGVMEKAIYEFQRNGQIEKVPVVITKDYIKAFVDKVIKTERRDIPLEDAQVIVAGGRGLGNKEGFQLLEQLAKKLGGTIGASRGAIENGWISENLQIGLTGKTVRPRLYIACGISGASQHVVGMQDSACIVAIDKNPDSEIFKVAHYGIVGDLYDIVPELIKSI